MGSGSGQKALLLALYLQCLLDNLAEAAQKAEQVEPLATHDEAVPFAPVALDELSDVLTRLQDSDWQTLLDADPAWVLAQLGNVPASDAPAEVVANSPGVSEAESEEEIPVEKPEADPETSQAEADKPAETSKLKATPAGLLGGGGAAEVGVVRMYPVPLRQQVR